MAVDLQAISNIFMQKLDCKIMWAFNVLIMMFSEFFIYNIHYDFM